MYDAKFTFKDRIFWKLRRIDEECQTLFEMMSLSLEYDDRAIKEFLSHIRNIAEDVSEVGQILAHDGNAQIDDTELPQRKDKK